jgi:hypothetical protein
VCVWSSSSSSSSSNSSREHSEHSPHSPHTGDSHTKWDADDDALNMSEEDGDEAAAEIRYSDAAGMGLEASVGEAGAGAGTDADVVSVVNSGTSSRSLNSSFGSNSTTLSEDGDAGGGTGRGGRGGRGGQGGRTVVEEDFDLSMSDELESPGSDMSSHNEGGVLRTAMRPDKGDTCIDSSMTPPNGVNNEDGAAKETGRELGSGAAGGERKIAPVSVRLSPPSKGEPGGSGRTSISTPLKSLGHVMGTPDSPGGGPGAGSSFHPPNVPPSGRSDLSGTKSRGLLESYWEQEDTSDLSTPSHSPADGSTIHLQWETSGDTPGSPLALPPFVPSRDDADETYQTSPAAPAALAVGGQGFGSRSSLANRMKLSPGRM